MTGVSLRPAIDTGRSTDRPVYSETFYPRFHFGWSELVAATEARYRYVRAPRPELYDLATDPGERQQPDRGEGATWPRRWTRGSRRRPAPGRRRCPRRWLRKRGNGSRRSGTWASARAGPRRGSTRSHGGRAAACPTPRTRSGSTSLLRQALVAKGAGRFAEAAADLQKIVAHERAACPRRGRRSARRCLRLDRSREGTAALRASAGARPRAAHHDDGARRGAFRQTSTRQQGLALYERAEALRRTRGLGELPGLHSGTGDCLARLGRMAEAEREMRAEVAAFSGVGRGAGAGWRALSRPGPTRRRRVRCCSGRPPASPDAEAYAAILGALQDLDDAAAAAREWARRAHAAFPGDPRFR